jgi:hypothetical protein
MGIIVKGKLIGLSDNKLKGYALCSEYVEIELPISEEDIREAVNEYFILEKRFLRSKGRRILFSESDSEGIAIKVFSLLTEGKGGEKVVDKKQTADIKHWDFLCPFCNYRIMIKTDRCPQCNYLLNSKPEEKEEQPEKSCESCECAIRDCRKEPKEKKAGLKCRDCSHYVDDLNCNIDVCIGFENFKPKQPKESIDWSEIECYVMENPEPNDTINCLQSYLSKRHNKLVEIVKELWRRNK